MRMKAFLRFVDLALHRSPVLYFTISPCFVKGSFMALTVDASDPSHVQYLVPFNGFQQDVWVAVWRVPVSHSPS